MPKVQANGIDIEYVTDGDHARPPLLLVMGLGAQLITWPQGFVDGLCERGFFVIRFDNRDSGLSTKLEGMPEITALFGGDTTSAPYQIEDMADDAAGLLTALGLSKVHVVGASLGGMITQALTIHHQDRFLSACSIMSTTGDRSVGAPTSEAIAALLRPIATSREEAIEASVAGSKVIGSPAYPADEPSQVSSVTSPAYKVIERTIREVLPGTIVAPGLLIAATDSRHMSAVADDIYRFSPVRAHSEDLARFHGTDERMSISNYVELIRFYHALIHNAARPD